MDTNQVNEPIHIEGQSTMSQLQEVAGVGARSYAFVLDWHIRLLVALVWIYLSAFLLYDLSVFATVFAGDPANSAALVIFLPATAVYFLYHPALETAMKGSTPGKRLAGVRLITHTGATPGCGRILIRNLLRLIDGIPGVYTVGLLVAIFTSNHVRIGDIAAGTLLVYEDKNSQRTRVNRLQPSFSSGLSPDNQALLLELLERWQQLDKKQRVHLAQQFLAKTCDDFRSDDPAQLQARLQALAGEDR
jgi:uncharacterized RDD family membrane protein YckC